MAKPACRKTADVDIVHCSVPIRAQGCSTVIVNGLPWSCFGHLNHPHLLPCPIGCCVHVAPIVKGSPIVICEGRPAGRIGDPTCTAVATGSKNVFAGP